MFLAIPIAMAQEGWTANPATGHYYKLTDAELSWSEAAAAALGTGGYLATVNDAAENAWLLANITGGAVVWIGANDKAVEGRWVWQEGGQNFWNGKSTGSLVSGWYAHWNGGEPNDSGSKEDAGEMRDNGTWNDGEDSTSRKHKGIIEISPWTGPASGTIEYGQDYTFAVYPRAGWSTGSATYRWFFNGNPIDGATVNAYTVKDAEYDDQGYYQCEITVSGAVIMSETKALVVLAPGTMPVAGATALGLLGLASALAGVRALRRR